jgi:hypothetical protein
MQRGFRFEGSRYKAMSQGTEIVGTMINYFVYYDQWLVKDDNA